MAQPETPVFSATDLINIMKAAAETGVLSMRIGDTEFTRTGYVPKPTADSAQRELMEQVDAGRNWSEALPPSDAFETI